MVKYFRTIPAAQKPLFEQAVAEIRQGAPDTIAIIAANELPAGMVELEIGYTSPLVLFALGMKVGQLERKGGQQGA